ncbi:MAG TPA: hypothetical protein VKP65_22125 [Rhodothermales bacterium]|nr:hypothetical protein [Rhodothermales bacterium]
MRHLPISAILLVLLCLMACAERPADAVLADETDSLATSPDAARVLPDTAATALPSTATLAVTADSVVAALADSNWTKLASYVHPEHGVRFVPYSYVDSSAQVFTRAQIPRLGGGSQTYLWGNYDGTGDPIELTFGDYYNEFIYDKAYRQAPQGDPNEQLGSGNSLNNIADFYAGRDVSFVEYYVPGTDEYNGMNWGSLRLVFEQEDNAWYLVAIIHDEWTI